MTFAHHSAGQPNSFWFGGPRLLAAKPGPHLARDFALTKRSRARSSCCRVYGVLDHSCGRGCYAVQAFDNGEACYGAALDDPPAHT